MTFQLGPPVPARILPDHKARYAKRRYDLGGNDFVEVDLVLVCIEGPRADLRLRDGSLEISLIVHIDHFEITGPPTMRAVG